MQCLHCIYYVRHPDKQIGDCHGNPPTVMLLPMQAPKAQQIASGGTAQGFALQTVRATVQAIDVACGMGKQAMTVTR